MWLRRPPATADWVAFPENEQDVVDIPDWAQQPTWQSFPTVAAAACAAGVEPAVGDGYAGTVSLDLERLQRVLEVDAISRAAHIQGAPHSAQACAQLKPHGYAATLPQSFEFSSLGGWIATRAGGHYATLHTHIDDFVESTRLVTPSGTLPDAPTARLGAGPL